MLATILGILSGIWSFATQLLQYIQQQSLIAMGRKLEQGDVAKANADATQAASDVLQQNVSREDVKKSLNDGSFRTLVSLNASVERKNYRCKNTVLSMSGTTKDIENFMLVAIGAQLLMVIFVHLM